MTASQPRLAVAAHDLSHVVDTLERVSLTGHATLDHVIAQLTQSAREAHTLASRLADTTPKNWSAS